MWRWAATAAIAATARVMRWSSGQQRRSCPCIKPRLSFAIVWATPSPGFIAGNAPGSVHMTSPKASACPTHPNREEATGTPGDSWGGVHPVDYLDRRTVNYVDRSQRNALRAGLVASAEEWRWGSLAQRLTPSAVAPPLGAWPVPRPRRWVERVNRPLSPSDEEALQRSLQRGQPYGGADWQAQTTARLGLESTFRPRGRPKKQNNGS
jgi:hypothetical protein